jgi:ABC-2 type transport system permease protein
MNGETTTRDPLTYDERPAPAGSPTRPLYWSVRREIWENRFIYLAPLLVTGVVLVACLIGLGRLPERVGAVPVEDPAVERLQDVRPFSMAPAPIMLATFLIGLFYSLEALYGERRERSILFWKSLPISDRTVVLSKAAIPLAVLPAIALALSLAIVALMLLVGTLYFTLRGSSPAPLWQDVRLLHEPFIMVYGLAVHTLWFAPIYGWLLLVSAWSRRMPLLWAVIPPFAIIVIERIAFGATHFRSMLKYRINGAMKEGFDLEPGRENVDLVSQLDPIGFFTTPGLWLGLAFTALCLAAAVRLRGSREPL